MNEDETVEFVNYLWAQWPNHHVSIPLVSSYHAWIKQHAVTAADAYRIGQKALSLPDRYGPPTTAELEAIRRQETRTDKTLFKALPEPCFRDSERGKHEYETVISSEKYKALMKGAMERMK